MSIGGPFYGWRRSREHDRSIPDSGPVPAMGRVDRCRDKWRKGAKHIAASANTGRMPSSNNGKRSGSRGSPALTLGMTPRSAEASCLDGLARCPDRYTCGYAHWEIRPRCLRLRAFWPDSRRGGMAEWWMAVVLKTTVRGIVFCSSRPPTIPRRRSSSPQCLHDWGRFERTPENTGGLPDGRNYYRIKPLEPKVARHQPVGSTREKGSSP